MRACPRESESCTEAFVIRTDAAGAFEKANRPCNAALTEDEESDFEKRFGLTSPGAETLAQFVDMGLEIFCGVIGQGRPPFARRSAEFGGGAIRGGGRA